MKFSTTKTSREKREFTRAPIKLEAEVTAGETVIISDETRDVSMRGLYVLCDQRLPVGTGCRVVLFLGGRPSQVRIEATGIIARIKDSGMAVQFNEMETDSFVHLRNLVLANAADTACVEQELSGHLGLKRRE